jgi:hypothetical protein
MSQRITIQILDKIATCLTELPVVCGNSDYVIDFEFDEEWDNHDVKTAVFVVKGQIMKQVFTGTVCEMPVFQNTLVAWVGVFAGTIDDGTLSTSTPALVHCKPCVTDGDNPPAPPQDDVYNQIVALCESAVATAESVEERANNGEFKGDAGYTPQKGIDYYTDEDKDELLTEMEEIVVGYSKGYKTGYDEGKEKGLQEGYDKGYKDGDRDGHSTGYNEGYGTGLYDGKMSGQVVEKQRFWNANQKNGTETYYPYHYAGNGWTDETYDPPYPITATANANYMFCGSWITDTKVPITLGANSNHYRLFYDANKLVTIRKLIVNKDTKFDSSSFQGCTALQTLTIVGEIGCSLDLGDCDDLTVESVKNTFAHLSDTTSGLTLTIHTRAKSRYVVQHSTTDWNKLVNSKKNWTIAIVNR